VPVEDLAIRLATSDDAAIIAEHRARIFQDTGRFDAKRSAAMMAQIQPIPRPMLASDEYVGWLVVAVGGAVVAGAGVQNRRLLHFDRPARAHCPGGGMLQVTAVRSAA